MVMIQSSFFDPVSTLPPWLYQRAVFSPCRSWRYMLCRHINAASEKILLVIGLNPSTADETQDDPTIRRCVALTARQGCGVLLMGNLFAWRATNPQALYAVMDPMGEDNTAWLLTMAKHATQVICAWGNHGAYLDQGRFIAQVIAHYRIPLFSLGTTRKGQPKHPLYLANSTPVRPWLETQEDASHGTHSR